MIFDISHWALTKRILADSQLLLMEYHEKVEPNMMIKPQTRTSFAYELFAGNIGMFPLLLDPRLWSNDEKRQFNGFDGKPRIKNTQCEVIWNIINDFPAIRQIYWTVIQPNVEFKPHYGCNGVIDGKIADQLRLQFCWETGPGAEFHTEKTYLNYVPGLKFGFHDGMDLHWAFNRGSEPRAVLLMDVWRDMVESDNIPHPDAIVKDLIS